MLSWSLIQEVVSKFVGYLKQVVGRNQRGNGVQDNFGGGFVPLIGEAIHSFILLVEIEGKPNWQTVLVDL